MKNQKALLHRRRTFFGVVIALLVLIAALAISLSAKSPETPAQGEISAMPLKTVQPVFSAQTSLSAKEIIPLESAPEPEIERLGEFDLTAYCPCVKCCGEWSAEHPSRVGTDYIQKTASGTIPTAGRTIGVDPSVIPFGTTVIISGHEYVAEDRGGAIKGNRIGIFFDDHDEALEFGRQTAEVFIINNKED